LAIDNGIVVLPDSVPVSMRWSSVKVTDAQRKDPETGFISTVKRWSAQVTELNGRPVMTVFDTLAEKLGVQMEALAAIPDLGSKLITLTKTGSGYLTNYSMTVA